MPGQDKATPSLGSAVKLGNGASPEVFTAIAEVKSFDIGGKTTMLDSTNLADTFKGFKPGIKEIGPIKLNCNFLPTDATQGLAATGLMFAWATSSLRNFQIVWQDGAGNTVATWIFAAYVSEWSGKANVTALISGDFSLTVDGIPAFI